MFKDIKVKDIAVRAVKTFVQAFLATLAVTAVTVHDVNTLRAVLVGAVAAGVSAVWNSVTQVVQSR